MGAPLNNKNAEQWTLDDSIDLFNKAYKYSLMEQYDFIGEIARDLKVYRTLFDYLSNKFKELKPLYSNILNNLEANCFEHSKKGKIREATAIVNLKSNHGWTDRQTHEIPSNIKISFKNGK